MFGRTVYSRLKLALAGLAFLALFIFVLLYASMERRQKTTSPAGFNLEEPIPIGTFSVTVLRYTQNAYFASPGEMLVIVHLRFSGEAPFDRYAFAGIFSGLVLLDDQGVKYIPTSPVPDTRDLGGLSDYLQPGKGAEKGPRPNRFEKEFEVVFKVPQRSSLYTLLIPNPDPREGQPVMAKVKL